MTSVVKDTHALIWYLLDDLMVSVAAGDSFDNAAAAGERIYVPSICIFETTYLVEKKRVPEAVLGALDSAIADPDSPLRLIELNNHRLKAVGLSRD